MSFALNKQNVMSLQKIRVKSKHKQIKLNVATTLEHSRSSCSYWRSEWKKIGKSKTKGKNYIFKLCLKCVWISYLAEKEREQNEVKQQTVNIEI